MIHTTPLMGSHLQVMLILGLAGCLVIGINLARTKPAAPRAHFSERPQAGRLIRLAAGLFGFGAACLAAPLPVLAIPGFGGISPSGSEVLLLLPILAIFTAIFAGAFALPIILSLAWCDVRSVGCQVAWGMAATLPAMAFFAVSMPGDLTGPIASAIVIGGAVGGFVCSAARDGVETLMQRIALRPQAGFGPERMFSQPALQSRDETH